MGVVGVKVLAGGSGWFCTCDGRPGWAILRFVGWNFAGAELVTSLSEFGLLVQDHGRCGEICATELHISCSSYFVLGRRAETCSAAYDAVPRCW